MRLAHARPSQTFRHHFQIGLMVEDHRCRLRQARRSLLSAITGAGALFRASAAGRGVYAGDSQAFSTMDSEFFRRGASGRYRPPRNGDSRAGPRLRHRASEIARMWYPSAVLDMSSAHILDARSRESAVEGQVFRARLPQHSTESGRRAAGHARAGSRTVPSQSVMRVRAEG